LGVKPHEKHICLETLPVPEESRHWIDNLWKQIEDIEEGKPLPAVGKNRWTGKDKPVMRFMTVYPQRSCQRGFMMLKNPYGSIMDKWDVDMAAHCAQRVSMHWWVTFTAPDYMDRPQVYEISFYGPGHEIKKLKKAFEDEMISRVVIHRKIAGRWGIP
jgi:hypothetical protein